MLNRPCYSAAIAVVLLIFSAAPAAADAIDGNWCNGAKHLHIAGSTIVTSGGVRTQGEYGRHDFTYIVPGGEENAGRRVYMDLWGDDVMQLWPNGRKSDPKSGGTQIWKRCAAPTS